ncbi:hypothetical protein [Phenylobacterium sp. J367]|uniref:hypothetical protein n=1 Tax=Phenylobacterium sp. J367 TaxID=2898435 RepID=UPI0021519B02|nr:hypothetical protein [Phenylobacterium sp. J367]MCR5877741.1 hypothetical protein [Phenylobacterium sp. J367]
MLRRLLILAAVAAGLIALALIGLRFTPAARGAAIPAAAFAAARAGDDARFRTLVTPNATLWSYFDFANPLTAANTRDFLRGCQPVRTATAIDTVSIRFDCVRDARGSFIVDATLCRGRLHIVRWPEQGRRLLTPMPLLFDLVLRAFGQSPCPPAPLEGVRLMTAP